MSRGLSLTGIITFLGSIEDLNLILLLLIALQFCTIPADPVKVRRSFFAKSITSPAKEIAGLRRKF